MNTAEVANCKDYKHVPSREFISDSIGREFSGTLGDLESFFGLLGFKDREIMAMDTVTKPKIFGLLAIDMDTTLGALGDEHDGLIPLDEYLIMHYSEDHFSEIRKKLGNDPEIITSLQALLSSLVTDRKIPCAMRIKGGRHNGKPDVIGGRLQLQELLCGDIHTRGIYQGFLCEALEELGFDENRILYKDISAESIREQDRSKRLYVRNDCGTPELLSVRVVKNQCGRYCRVEIGILSAEEEDFVSRQQQTAPGVVGDTGGASMACASLVKDLEALSLMKSQSFR